jgi:putative transposase
VPGGGISKDGTQWLPSRADYFVAVRALSVLFRAKFRDALGRAGLLSQVDPAVWRQKWVVHSKAVGDGRASLKYLAPYVFRVAISDRRIVACNDGRVTFSYRRSGSNRWRKMTVDAFEFIRRFLQHVLPSGFPKVRHYGFLSPNSREAVEAVRWLVTLHYRLTYRLLVNATDATVTEPPIRCAKCGGPMQVLAFLPRPVATFDTS